MEVTCRKRNCIINFIREILELASIVAALNKLIRGRPAQSGLGRMRTPADLRGGVKDLANVCKVAPYLVL